MKHALPVLVALALLLLGPGFHAHAQTVERHLYVSVLDGDGLPEALSRLAFEIASEYRLVYAGADSLISPQTVEIGR